MSVDKKGDLRIIGWSIDVKWSNGKEEKIGKQKIESN